MTATTARPTVSEFVFPKTRELLGGGRSTLCRSLIAESGKRGSRLRRDGHEVPVSSWRQRWPGGCKQIPDFVYNGITDCPGNRFGIGSAPTKDKVS